MRLLELGHRLVIAHRGASRERLENTLPAFERALELGADAIELDVRLARDGTAVVIHDATLTRTAGHPAAVDTLTARELAGYQVPTLAEVLAAFPAAELLIEIKEPAAQAAVARAVAQAAAERRCVVAADDALALVDFRGGRIAVCGARPDIRTLRWRSLLGRPAAASGPAYRTLSVPRSYRGIPIATRGFFRAAAALGVPVHVWTIDDPRMARALWKAGATGIVTNDVAAVARARSD